MRPLAMTCIAVLASLLSACATMGGGRQAEELSVDQDILRLKHLRQIASLVESYKEATGHYPLAGQGWQGFPAYVYIDPQDVSARHYTTYTGEGVVLHPALFERTLETGLGRQVSLPHNPDSDGGKNAYLYEAVEDDYFLTIYTDHPLPFAKPLGDGRHGVAVTSRRNAESAWLYRSLTQYDPFILAAGAEPYDKQRLSNWMKQGMTPMPNPSPNDRLAYAIATGDRAGFSTAIAAKADINPVCPEHIPCRPLNLAARIGAPWMVQGLLSAGADPNGVDGHGDTPLLLANNHHSVSDAKAIMWQLLKAGADPNLPNHWAWTPFAAFAARGYVDLMDAALDKGADVNLAAPAPGVEAIEQGDPPLIAAIRTGQVQAVRWLLEHGADPDVLGYDGMDARQVARAVKRPVIIRLLHPPGTVTAP